MRKSQLEESLQILTEESRANAEKIFKLLKEANHVIIASPKFYDVDSICSCLLIHELLSRQGMYFPRLHTLFCAEKPSVKDNALLKFVEPELDLFSTVIPNYVPPHYVPPLVMVGVDYGNFKTCGIDPSLLRESHYFIGIDHHSEPAADFPENGLQLVNPNAVSTTAIIYNILRYRFPITRRIAAFAALGIMADIGGKLTHPKVNAETLQIIIDCIENGAPWEEIQEAAKPKMTTQRLEIWARANLWLRFLTDKVISLVVYRRTLAEWGGTRKDIETFFGNIMCSLEGVNLAILIFEQTDGSWRISFRSNNMETYSAAEFAKIFNGGGHHHAAVATYTGDPFGAEKMILSYLQEKTIQA